MTTVSNRQGTNRPWRIRTPLGAVVLIVGLSGFVSPVFGGRGAPSIEGRIVDSGGAAIPGAEVLLMPASGGNVRETISGSDGSFQFDGLPDGTYRVDADLLGFSVVRQNNIRVASGATARIQLTMSVGALCECVVSWSGPTPDPLAGLRVRDGQVTDEAGRPLPHAQLSVTDGTYPEKAYADRHGRFRVLLPSSRTWPLTVQDSGFERVTRQVASDSDAPLVFVLPKGSLLGVKDVEPLPRSCRCPRDLFVHKGR